MKYAQIFIGACLLTLTFIIHHAQANDNAGIPGSWAENPADHGGLDGTVFAIVSDGNGGIYAGGTIKSIDGAVVNRIARLDTTTDTWESLGKGVNGQINALVADDAGNVYAGGRFSRAGDIAASNIARWDSGTKSWESLSTGTEGEVRALAIDESGTLYAGVRVPSGAHETDSGSTIFAYVARWTPSTQSWSRVGLGMDNGIESLAVDSTGRLYAGGSFYSADNRYAPSIAGWNAHEQIWEPLGEGLVGYGGDSVYALVIDAEDNLYAGGRFEITGRYPADKKTWLNDVARWNVENEQWERLGAGIDPIDGWPIGDEDSVYALAIDGQGRLLAGGVFESATGVMSQSIALWDPETGTWQALDFGLQGDAAGLGLGTVFAIASHDDGKVYVGGDFGTAGRDVITTNIGRWNPASSLWEGLGSGIEIGSIYSVVEDRAGNTFIGGTFETINGSRANYIAYKDAAEEFWVPIRLAGSENGVPPGMDDAVYSLLLDGEGNLYAGGSFNLRAGTTREGVHGVARLSASTQQWEALGHGLPDDSRVEALAIGKSGNIYVGGTIYPTGSLPVRNIARWNVFLQQWESLGRGLENTVKALVVDSSENVIALSRVDNSTVSIHRWSRQEQVWQSLGPISNDGFGADLAIDGSDNLYTVIGDSYSEDYVARWSDITNSWAQVGKKTNGHLLSIIVDSNNQLIAGGSFTKIGDTTANNLAVYNAEQRHWQALEQELDGPVGKLHARNTGGFYASAWYRGFRLAGDVATPGLALWSPDSTSTIVPTLELTDARWRQISLPCDAATESTVSQLFGDDELGNYGTDWIMWGYDAVGREYTAVNQQTEISPGQAYWIFQRSNSSRQIDVPASCSATPRVGSCPNPDGCFEVPLYGDSQVSTYQMVGYPFSTPGRVDETYVITDTPDCAQGCVTGSDEANKYLYPLLFTYDGESYKTAGPEDNFSPWAGYWAIVRPAAANANARLGFAQ